MAGVAALIAAYPPDVIEAALSPISGVPAKFKFMPSIAELKEDLEGRMPRWEPPKTAALLEAPARAPRPTMEELKAKYGPNWGLSEEPTRKRPTFRSVADIASDIATSFSKAAE